MVVFLFSLLSSIIFLALAKSFFHWEVISLASVLSLILLKKNNITFGFFKEIFCSSRKEVFFYSCLVFSIFVTFAYFEGFDEGQDARGTHLPTARFIALNHVPPTGMDLSENAPLIPLITPGIHGLAAVLFQITGLQRAWIASLIPLSFSFLFLAVVFRWSYNYSQTLIIPAVAILISPFFVNRMEWFYQEAPLTFATTLLLYCLYRFEIEGKEEYLYSAMALSAIIMMIKATGMLICTFMLYFIFSRRLYSKSNLIVLFLFHVPPLLWYGYNLYLWGNPFPPHMNSITIYEWSNKAIAAMLEVAFQHDFNEWHNILFGATALPFVYLWLFLEILCIKKKKRMYDTRLEREVFIFFVLFSLVFFSLFSHTLEFRYLMPFYGYIIVRSVKLIKGLSGDEEGGAVIMNLFKKVQDKLNRSARAFVLLLLIFVIGFQYSYVRWVFPDHVGPYLRAIDFLTKEGPISGGQRLVIFADTDHGFRWYGNFFVIEPFQPIVATDFLEAQKSGDMLNFVRKYNITHVVNSPWNSPWEKIYTYIEHDERHFIRIYEKESLVIWKVII